MKKLTRTFLVLMVSLGLTLSLAGTAHAAWRWVGYYPTEKDCRQRGAARVNFHGGKEFDCHPAGDYGWSLSVNYYN